MLPELPCFSLATSKVAACPAKRGMLTGAGLWRRRFVPALANFSILYNFTSASIAMRVISTDEYLGWALYPEPAWSRNIELALVYVGTMAGMLFMGRLGDLIGVARAMRATQVLSMLGAAIPALAAGPPNLAYGIIAVGRLVLGIGVGGAFPLSAISAVDSCDDSSRHSAEVSRAIFWHTPGAVAPYILSVLFWLGMPAQGSASSGSWVLQLQFRLLFLLGAVPALIVFLLADRTPPQVQPDVVGKDAAVHRRRGFRSTLCELQREPAETRHALVGCASVWFTFDFAYYGTNTYLPVALASLCLNGTHDAASGGCRQSLGNISAESGLVSLMGLPGCIAAIFCVGCIGCKRLNCYGFVLLAAAFAALAFAHRQASDSGSTPLLFLFSALQFALFFGPNVGTYVLPALCFPTHLRTTCHGIACFGGKLGAVLATCMFPSFTASYGLSAMFCLQTGVCIVGAVLSHLLLRHDWEYLNTEDALAQPLLRLS
eukprot:NODE_4512_length_1882_cov_10.322507.p1 GENE.NODE_4512_length_1882_cov_10.322507~~NODE_4512_length_1882_cov_10.322507.p1  ORF type:complete len:488 (-),score=112.45 NODE_4512_length_1882_cov_10.322507:280-1743(-)